jgi:hypothetical protein
MIATARAISILGHPAVETAAAMLLLVGRDDAARASSVALGAAIVMGYSWWQVRRGLWAHVDASNRRERECVRRRSMSSLGPCPRSIGVSLAGPSSARRRGACAGCCVCGRCRRRKRRAGQAKSRNVNIEGRSGFEAIVQPQPLTEPRTGLPPSAAAPESLAAPASRRAGAAPPSAAIGPLESVSPPLPAACRAPNSYAPTSAWPDRATPRSGCSYSEVGTSEN